MKSSLLFAAIIGILAVAGWAPLACWPVALIAYALLGQLLSQTHSSSHATKIGLSFGLTFHLTAHHWVFKALHIHSGLSTFPACLSTLFFAFYLSLFTAIPCGLWYALRSRQHYITSHLSNVLLLSSLLTLGEWARSLFFNGFTSLSLGYALIDSWLAGYAPILGTYGLSFIGYTLSIWMHPRPHSLQRKTLLQQFSALSIVFLSGYLLSQITWVKPAGHPLSYRLIQVHTPQDDKFNPSLMLGQIQNYLDTIEAQRADLIITPETAFPVFLNALPPNTLSHLQNFSRLTQSHLLLGVATLASSAEGYNSIIHLQPHNAALTQYNKITLMPFGEYSPLGFRWFTEALNIPLKDLSAGSYHQPPFLVNHQKIGTLICHEDSSGQMLRHWLPEATLLVMPSNLGWFEHTLFTQQNLQTIRMRALEGGRPILRASNTGPSVLIDHHGTVVHQLPEGLSGTLAGHIQPMQGTTPYVYWGDSLIIAILALIPTLNTLTLMKKTT